MNRKFIFFVILLIALAGLAPVATTRALASDPPEVLQTSSNQEIISKKLDRNALILQQYLAQFNSPMTDHAQDFIDAAKFYDLDWKLLPAIAGVESTFGKHIPGGYNAYGWAIYNSSSRFGFESWRDGMFVVAKGLRENYINKGLTDPYAMNRIYATSKTWGSKVTYFMQDLEKFEKNFLSEIEPKTITLVPKIAAESGQIDSN